MMKMMNSFLLVLLLSVSAMAQNLVNGASQVETKKIAPESWVTVYGANKCKAFLVDSAGSEYTLKINYCDDKQLNLYIPAVNYGKASILLKEKSLDVEIVPVSAGIFTFNGTGTGLPVGYLLRIRNNIIYNEIFAGYDTNKKEWLPIPISWNTGADRLFLALYGTGIRQRDNLSQVFVTIAGIPCQVTYAGSTGQEGIDQLNVEIPRSLEGKGKVKIKVFIKGELNETTIFMK